MHLIINNKVFDKSKIAAWCSFIAGIVFFIGICLHLIWFFSWSAFLKQISQITTQMNLLTMFVSGLYIFKPDHRFFKNNLLIIFATIMIWFVGLGFWFILFPVYYINLGDFLISRDDIAWYNFSLFYAMWNHTVTPIAFLFFFYHISKKINLYYLTPLNTKSILFVIGCYSVVWIAINIIFSFCEGLFPTYGVLTNFNPYTKFVSEKHNTNLFNIKFLLASHIACLFMGFSLTVFFSSISIKFGIINHYKLTNKILRHSVKSLKGFS